MLLTARVPLSGAACVPPSGMTAKTYRAQPFLEAAGRLGVEAVRVVDMPQSLAEFWRNPLGVDFAHPEWAVQAIVVYAALHPLEVILSAALV